MFNGLGEANAQEILVNDGGVLAVIPDGGENSYIKTNSSTILLNVNQDAYTSNLKLSGHFDEQFANFFFRTADDNITTGMTRFGVGIKNGTDRPGIPNTDYTEALTILPNSNVGIGSSNPTEKLEVNGHARMNGNIYMPNSYSKKSIYTWDVGDENWRIGMNDNPGFTRAIATNHVQYMTYFSQPNQGFAVGVNGGNSSFEVTGDHRAFFRGNVGLGVIDPLEKLHVNGNIRFEANGDGLRWNNYSKIFDDADLKILTDNNIYIGKLNADGTFGNCAIYTDVNLGNVGIGTVSPTEKLEVNGNTKLNGQVGVGREKMDGVQLAVKGSVNISGDDDKTVFHVSSRLDKVFVGKEAHEKYLAAVADPTTGTVETENYSLWVSQGINATDFALSDITNWNDFVFAKDYKLPTLKETEIYIAKNKHLPYIPSEADVKKNGYSVHDMNRGFLQTIEEMTLHSIEQEKKLNLLENELIEIKALLLSKK